MRIAMVHSSFAIRGGAEQYVRDLSAALVDRGHEVQVFSRPSPHSLPTDAPVDTRISARLGGADPRLGKVLTHLGDLADPTGLRLNALRDFAPDVVHVHNWQGLGVLPLARIARTWPTCHTVHDYAVADPNNSLANQGRSDLTDRLLRARSAWLVRQLRGVSLLWPAARTRDIAQRHLPQGSTLGGTVVPLAVPETGGPVSWPAGNPAVFLFLGALSEHKGIDLLLAAWREVAGQDGATLLIGGDGPRRADVEAAARKLPGLEYLGFLDTAGKQAAMARAGWLVFPSQWAENFPISCVEALRAGRPIISSEVARPPMASDESLRIFRTRAELTETMRRAASMPPADYDTIAAAAARDGRELNWDRHVDAVVDAYTALRADDAGRRRVPATRR
ncbi:glycosyltransferase [Micromonospora profundi]|uniref:Glycosyltransferase n=1 Tax=Micromonospora profundi TaxID=1420889 RepID=A0AAJ6HTP8_9ACTN|nr:glycosyltransferase [Micromonospora profundi]NJC14385.1 glycosyltransferase involved in cell wall biosynthesis [Micromonospora profundi]WLS45942.1 glycosyltransferase [Micromonospora profundi]